MLGAMSRRVRATVLLLVLVGACGNDGAPAGGPAGLRGDLDKICNAVVMSGAAEMEPSDRMYTMAQWLSANVTSPAGVKFLQDFARLGDDRVARLALLQNTATQVGLKTCPLTDDWR